MTRQIRSVSQSDMDSEPSSWSGWGKPQRPERPSSRVARQRHAMPCTAHAVVALSMPVGILRESPPAQSTIPATQPTVRLSGTSSTAQPSGISNRLVKTTHTIL